MLLSGGLFCVISLELIFTFSFFSGDQLWPLSDSDPVVLRSASQGDPELPALPVLLCLGANQRDGQGYRRVPLGGWRERQIQVKTDTLFEGVNFEPPALESTLPFL